MKKILILILFLLSRNVYSQDCTLTGDKSPCTNVVQQYKYRAIGSPCNAYANYYFELDGVRKNASPTSEVGGAIYSVDLTFYDTFSAVLKLYATETYIDGGNNSQTRLLELGTINIQPKDIPPTPSLDIADGTPLLCPNTVYTYSIVQPIVSGNAPVTSYNLNLPSGWVRQDQTSTTTISFKTGTTGGTITLSANSACGKTANYTKSFILPTNLAAPVFTSLQVPCAEPYNVILFTVNPVPGADYYVWTYPATWKDAITNKFGTITTTGPSLPLIVDGTAGTNSISVYAHTNLCSGANSPTTVSPVVTIPSTNIPGANITTPTVWNSTLTSADDIHVYSTLTITSANANVSLAAGRTLYVENGGTLIVENNAKLIGGVCSQSDSKKFFVNVKTGGILNINNIIYGTNVEITSLGTVNYNGTGTINGIKLILSENSAFNLSNSSNLNFLSSTLVANVPVKFNAGTSTTLKFQQTQQELASIFVYASNKRNADLNLNPDKLIINNCSVNLDGSVSIVTDPKTHVLISDAIFDKTGTSNYSGLTTKNKDTYILSSNFYHAANAITVLTVGQSAAANSTINSCTFKNCGTCINCYTGGMDVLNCNFSTSNSAVYGYGMNQSINVTGTDNNIVYDTDFGMQLFGTASCEARVSGYYFTQNHVSAISSDGIQLSLKCNTFTGGYKRPSGGGNNSTYAIQLGLENILNMSTTFNAGYNKFYDNQNNIYVQFARAVRINEGNNSFVPSTTSTSADKRFAFFGDLLAPGFTACTTTPCGQLIVPGNNNYWGVDGQIPLPKINYDLANQGACPGPVTILITGKAATKDIVCGSPQMITIPKLTQIINTKNFPATQLSVAAATASAKRTINGGTSNLQSIALFNEILSYPYRSLTAYEDEVLESVYRSKFLAIADAVVSGEIDPSKPLDLIKGTRIGGYLPDNPCLQLPPILLNGGSSIQKNRIALDEALLYRLIGRPDLALNDINDIKAPAGSVESVRINQWKCMLDNEIKYKNGLITASEFLSNSTVCKLNMSNQRLADGNTSDIEDGSFKVGIYPNPSSSEVNVNFSIDNDSEISVQIMDLTGKIVFTPVSGAKYYKGNNTINVSNSTLNNGVYFMNLIINNENHISKMTIIK